MSTKSTDAAKGPTQLGQVLPFKAPKKAPIRWPASELRSYVRFPATLDEPSPKNGNVNPHSDVPPEPKDERGPGQPFPQR